MRIYYDEIWFKPHDKDYDLLSTLRKQIIKIQPSIKFKWVEGHQDDKKNVNQLGWWAQKNILCDKMAKHHLSQVATTQPRPLAYQGQLPEENIRILIGNKKLTSVNRNYVYERLTQELTLNAWIKNGRLTNADKDKVDWSATGKAMESLTLSKRRWVTKHMSGNCGVGTTLVR